MDRNTETREKGLVSSNVTLDWIHACMNGKYIGWTKGKSKISKSL